MSSEQQFEELQKRVSALEAENATLKSAAAPAQRAASVYIEPTARIERAPPGSIFCDPRMPTDDDLLKLLSIVRSDYPTYKPHGWSAARVMDYVEDFKAFKLAFRWQLDIKRGDFEMHHTVSYWAGRAENFAHVHGMNDDVGGSQLLAACIAAGDVPFLDPNLYGVNMMHVGLSEKSAAGRPTNAQAWRRVLAVGKAPPASNYRPAQYETNPVEFRRAV